MTNRSQLVRERSSPIRSAWADGPPEKAPKKGRPVGLSPAGWLVRLLLPGSPMISLRVASVAGAAALAVSFGGLSDARADEALPPLPASAPASSPRDANGEYLSPQQQPQ